MVFEDRSLSNVDCIFETTHDGMELNEYLLVVVVMVVVVDLR